MPTAPSLPVRHTLRPGQRGTTRYVAEYGERLVCVCHRFDADRQQRVTTVELVVDRVASVPRAGTLVGVRVAWGEAEVARRVKRAGGSWDAGLKLWRLPAGDARRLGLEERVVRLPAKASDVATDR